MTLAAIAALTEWVQQPEREEHHHGMVGDTIPIKLSLLTPLQHITEQEVDF